jgi:hypothetical protein
MKKTMLAATAVIATLLAGSPMGLVAEPMSKPQPIPKPDFTPKPPPPNPFPNPPPKPLPQPKPIPSPFNPGGVPIFR